MLAFGQTDGRDEPDSRFSQLWGCAENLMRWMAEIYLPVFTLVR